MYTERLLYKNKIVNISIRQEPGTEMNLMVELARKYSEPTIAELTT